MTPSTTDQPLMPQTKTRWSNATLLVGVLVIAYILLFLPFWKPVVIGFIFACACDPLLNRVRRHWATRRTKLAYAALGFSILLLVGFVTLIVLNLYSMIYGLIEDPSVLQSYGEKAQRLKETAYGWLDSNRFLEGRQIGERIDQSVVRLLDSSRALALGAARAFAAKAPQVLLTTIIFIAAFGAFLVVGPRAANLLGRVLNDPQAGRSHFANFERVCGISLGSIFLTGFVQSCLVTAGAAIAGLPGLVLIFLVTFIFALIPVLGAGLVPVLLALFSIVDGNWTGVIVLAATAAIAGVADNIIRAWLFSRAAQTNAAISLISLLGGIALLGFAGLFIAPVLEQLVMKYFFLRERTAVPEVADGERRAEPRRDALVTTPPIGSN